jgi:hypothetical protein
MKVTHLLNNIGTVYSLLAANPECRILYNVPIIIKKNSPIFKIHICLQNWLHIETVYIIIFLKLVEKP